MSRGYHQHTQRRATLHTFGRHLARRAGSSCELCSGRGVSLVPWEVAPLPPEPELERAILLCEGCLEAMGRRKLEPDYWRFLEVAAWAELPAVQVTAVRLTRRLAQAGVSWADDLLGVLYLPPETEAWLDEGLPRDP